MRIISLQSGSNGNCIYVETEDVRLLAGTMGRFPSFRDTGWRILESARIFGGSEEAR